MAATTRTTRGPITIDSQGQLTNPASTILVADTGQLPAGRYECRVLVGASAASEFALQHRNAANSGNVDDVIVLRAILTSEFLITFDLAVNERVRIVMNATQAAGVCEGSLNVERLG